MLTRLSSALVKFKDLLGLEVTMQEYLRQGYIRVKSREELLDAISYVNTFVKARTEIRLAKNFKPWTAATTDIDLTWVSLVGEGQATYIDCTGIPDVEGNYAAKFFCTPEANIDSISYLGGDKYKNIIFRGRGRDSKVDGLIFESSGAGKTNLASIALHSPTVFGFRSGITIGSNAFIIHMFQPRVDRCGLAHIHMKAGSNTGEGVHLFGGTISTSNGVGILNENPNGAVRCFGTSLDYMGAVAKSVRGAIELNGCHMEFENGTNDLNQIPFRTSSAQDSSILISGGEILSYKGTNAISQPAVFESLPGGGGIRVRDTLMFALVTPTGKLKQGGGEFSITGTHLYAGGGNPAVSRMQDPEDNLAGDGYNKGSRNMWYISRVTSGAPTSRTESTTGTITFDASVAPDATSAGSMKVSKLFGAGSNFDVSYIVPISEAAQITSKLKLQSNLSFTAYMNMRYVSLSHYDNIGRPVFDRAGSATTRNIALGQGSFVEGTSFAARNPAPKWATHYMVTLGLAGMPKGDLFIGAAEVFSV